MWLILSCLSYNNRGPLLQNRRRSTRQRSALGSTLQRTWTSAVKVGGCFVNFYLLIYCLLVSVSTLPCHQCLKVNLNTNNDLSFTQTWKNVSRTCWSSTCCWRAWRSSIARTRPRPLVRYRWAHEAHRLRQPRCYGQKANPTLKTR